jgi:polar amino acid transport system substrate-binding protein
VIRKAVSALVVVATVAVGCSSTATPSSPTASGSALDCSKGSLHLLSPGKLTIATDNPAFQPWFAGDTSAPGSPWKADPNNGTGDPYSGKGYESATAYDVATQLGFTKDEVAWVPINFNNSYKPGAKPDDFYIGQVSFSTDRAQAVDFSHGYFDVQQALVANKGTPITSAKTFADLKGYTLGVQLGTTSYSYIQNNIQPANPAKVYDNANDVIAALNAGGVDGYLVDAPDAYVNVLIGEAKHGVVVGQFPTIGEQEHFALTFEKGNPLVACVNRAIDKLTSDGTLDQLRSTYLSDIAFPEITQ